jgi:ribosome maturation factor RimP
MSHPLIPQILQIAEAIATSLGLEVVDTVMQTHKNPAVLRVDVRNLEQNTGLEDCTRMSLGLEAALDQADLIPFPYELEVSSPGTDRQLQSDREFIAFRGFTVTVTANGQFEGKESWSGQLVSRDLDHLTLSLKGKIVSIPRAIVHRVELS